MNYLPRLKQAGRVLFLLTLFGVADVGKGWAQNPTFKAGEIVLYLQPGTPRQTANEIAAKVNAIAVEPLLLADCYKLVLPAEKQTPADTTASSALLKMDARVRWVGPNAYRFPLQNKVEPNDPRYKSNEQWNLRMMNMPQAWALQKGAAGVNLAIVDTGYRPQHEDAAGRFHAGSKDIADNDDDITADAPGLANDEQDHGTHTSGVFIARTNNNVGIAGICWENIQCVGLKAYHKDQTTPGFAITDLLNAYAYVAANRQQLKIVALNLSLGGQGDPNDSSNPEYTALKQLVDAGVVVVAAAGNSNADSNGFIPAGFPFCFTVASVGPSGAKASYSNFGKIDIAAPGGEQQAENDPNGILSLSQNNTYTFAQGTSDAAPHVTGVFGLLFSVPGMTRQLAEQTVKDTGNRTGLTAVPDRQLGYGIVDAYAALARVSIRADIEEPFGTDTQGNSSDPNGIPQPVQTLAPVIRISISNVSLSATDNAENLVLTIDGQRLPESALLAAVESGTTTGTFPKYTLALRLPPQFRRTGEHTITVQGTNTTTNTTTQDQVRFVVTPYTIPSGISFISIPYFENAADSPTGTFREALQLLGPDVTLYRWVYTPVATDGAPTAAGRYAVLSTAGSELPDNAKFKAADAVTSASAPNAITDVRPVGLAYFIRTPAAIPVVTYGQDFPKQEVRVPLHEGWNMVGDPYPYPVSFNTLLVETSTGDRLTAQQAVDQKLLLPYIYRFIGGEYTVQQLPAGLFAPWEGHWLFVRPRTSGTVQPNNVVTLIFSPTRAGTTSRSRAAGSGISNTTTLTSANGRPTVNGPGSWMLRLEARTGNMADSQNFVGMTTRATDGDDLTKVPKPPQPSPFVSLGISRPNSPNGLGLYAQDMRPIGGAKSWDVVVNTDQANSEVTLSWPEARSVPRNYRLTLTDKVTGQTVDVRNQSSFKYNSGRSAAPRTFVLTARPTGLTGRAVVSNIFVNPARGANGRSTPIYEIGYTVSQDVRIEVSVLSFGGKTLAQVTPTRSVTNGDNRVVWNGRDSAGRELPAGTYVLQIKAMTSEGEMTREIRPLVLTGR